MRLFYFHSCQSQIVLKEIDNTIEDIFGKQHEIPTELASLLLLLIIVKFLALALTNLVFDLANLVTNLAKPSLGRPGH